MSTESVFNQLVKCIWLLKEVQSIGRSGGRALPASSADGDIDIFVYCDAVPAEPLRRAALDAMGGAINNVKTSVVSGGRWGTADFAEINGIETWVMYFTEAEAAAEVESVLNGEHLSREGNFYPTGRCAMYLGMEILLDRSGFLASLQSRLSNYPDALAEKLSRHHLNALGDTEDFERAVARRDTLFYHFALEIALDHFLQALFALNHTFFPSRKRSLELMGRFKKKPARCEDRLLEVVRLGATSDGVEQSYVRFEELVKDIQTFVP